MSRVPLYKAAETEMMRRIRSGEWPVGLRLPNEFGLADEFGVSQGTMRRALMTLENQGLLTRKPGRGTIVAEPEPKAAPADGSVAGFDRVRDAASTPVTFEVFRARNTTRGATDEEAALFGTSRLSVIQRTLNNGGDRAVLDEVAIPEALVPEIPEDAPADLPALLDRLDLPVHGIEDRITPEMTSMADAVALSVDRHTALLVVTRVARNANGDPIARQVMRIADNSLGYDVTLGV
jgi:GntR family transcriptional regulator